MAREMNKQQKDDCKRRVKKIIGTKFNTTMIYPLNQFETVFGHIWGHGKPEDQLTPDELVYRAKYDEVRKSILDNGNQQKRNAWAELDMHEIIWNRYNVTLYTKGNH